MQCRSTSKLHPKTNQPLHFICTSLKQGETCVLAKEADLIDEGRKEAIAILDAVKKYCADCPKEWGSSLPESCFLESICIVTPWRMQVQVHVVGESTSLVYWGWARLICRRIVQSLLQTQAPQAPPLLLFALPFFCITSCYIQK